MIGSFITRGLALFLGYAYPAYECYKSIEKNKPDIEELQFWCQYWILVAGLTVCERIGDMFIGWVPMYSEAKLAFLIYLWLPRTKGTTYVYDSFFRPYVAKHETEIDRSLLELRTRAVDMALVYWKKAASYAQTGIFDILQYIASQSTPKQQAQHQGTRVQKPTVPSNYISAPMPQPPDGQTSSPASTASSSEHRDNAAEKAGASDNTKAAPSPAASKEQKTAPTQALSESSKTLDSNKEQVMQIDSVPTSTNDSAQPSLQDTAVEVARRVTRARSRKARTASNL